MRIITFERVSKRYRLAPLGARSLREEFAQPLRRLLRRTSSDHSADEFLALDDVSLEVDRGETLGIIGPNGSGKSTILKLLARITYPTTGRIKVFGSVASLIEVGAGFHPELTGRENVYLYGSIMGMRQAEIRAKFDQIVDFAGLHRFVDTPVKRFSSGMYVRLGFAVAAHLNPEVLLVDEVLAVGDADFRSRCLQRIEELRSRGMTIVFVSHDMAEIERLCNRAIFLSQGQIRAEGAPRQVIAEYYETVMAGAISTLRRQANDLDQPITTCNGALPEAEILNLRFLNQFGEPVEAIATGAPFVARIEYLARRPIEDPVFELLFHAPDGRLHCQYSTALADDPISHLDGPGSVEIASDALGLTPGLFAIDAALTRRGALSPYDRKRRAWFLKVLPGKPVRGLFYAPQRWRLLPPAEVGPPP